MNSILKISLFLFLLIQSTGIGMQEKMSDELEIMPASTNVVNLSSDECMMESNRCE